LINDKTWLDGFSHTLLLAKLGRSTKEHIGSQTGGSSEKAFNGEMIEEILELIRGLVRDQTPKMVLEVLRGNWDELLDEK